MKLPRTEAPPLNVLLIGNYAADRQQSMLGFASALQAGLCDRGITARMIAPARVFGRLGRPHDGVGKLLGYVDKFGLFPQALRRALAWADLVHVCDQGNAMYIPMLRHTPHVLTCHDLLAIRAAHGEMPGWKKGPSGQKYQHMILHGLGHARCVACVSEATRNDLLRISTILPENTTVVHNGLYNPYQRMPDDDSEPLLGALGIHGARPYLLHVGGNQPYKNRPGVLAIYAALRRLAPSAPLRLVLAGKPFTDGMRQDIADNGLTGYVTELTDPTNEQLRALYSRAAALIFPSLAEGFGLPIIEAQACGCPVFTSDRTPMTEVGGAAAIYFDPTAPQEAARIIASHMEYTGKMREAGFQNIQRFSTKRMVEEYTSLYHRLVRASD